MEKSFNTLLTVSPLFCLKTGRNKNKKNDKSFLTLFQTLIRQCDKLVLCCFSAAILQQSPPGMISMAGGMPNVDTFPVKSASMELRYVQSNFNGSNTFGTMKIGLRHV